MVGLFKNIGDRLPLRRTSPDRARTLRQRNLFLESLETRQVMAADGALDIQLMAAPNWIVDSNVESPAGMSPKAAYLGVRITNTSTTDTLTDVAVRFGDYQRTFRTSAPGPAPSTGISSNTITFQPNPATKYNPRAIGRVLHPYQNGDVVQYTKLGGSNNIGLTEGSKYEVVNATATSIQLRPVGGGVPIALTAGTGETHALRLARAGVYPETTITTDPAPLGANNLYAGTFSIQHEGGRADATRLIGSLAPGETVMQYWYVSYPLLDSLGRSVAGNKADQRDDLVLLYDVWAEADQNGTDRLAVVDDQTATLRSEITSSANKILPQTTSKVPDDILKAFEQQLGWKNGVSPTSAGVISVEGVWYDFGNVNQGFDNNGDFVPDYNAWAQPAGDPLAFDASSMRLVRTYGALVVKLNTGTDQIIAFEDQLYFENLSPNNTGVVGLVYYEFAPIGYGSATMTPYQEVASGRNNEKFNSDYGRGVAFLGSALPAVAFSKGVSPAVVTDPGTLTYTLSATNNDTVKVFGSLSSDFNLPPVIADTVPTNTYYVIGSADFISPATATRILYSIDGGLTWSSTSPTANTTCNGAPAYSGSLMLQWWSDGPLQPGETMQVEYQSCVNNYVVQSGSAIVVNEAELSVGGSEPVLTDDATALVSGPFTISGTTFSDNGAAGNRADGVYTVGEPTLPNLTVTLYVDTNNNGIIDTNDFEAKTATTDSSGFYQFTNLPAGTYLVEVSVADPDIPTGSSLTTTGLRDVTIVNANVTNQNFGFLTPLSIDKSVMGSSVVNQGATVSYTIDTANQMAVIPPNPVNVWSSAATFGTNWGNINTTTGAPNGTYASLVMSNGNSNPTGSNLVASGFNVAGYSGTITNVSVVLQTYLNIGAGSNTQERFRVTYADGTNTFSAEFTSPDLSALYNGISNARQLVALSLPTIPTLAQLNAATITFTLVSGSAPANTASTIFIDSLGYQITTDAVATPVFDINKTIQTYSILDLYNPVEMQFLAASVPPTGRGTIASATNASPIVITTTQPHGLSTGRTVSIAGVGGNAAANGTFTVTAIDATRFSLNGSTGNGAYTSGGTVGALYWDSLGPIDGGETQRITLTFRALTDQLADNIVNNQVLITGSTFANGLPGNTASDLVTIDINPVATFAVGDYIWYDTDGDGVQDSNEAGIGGVVVSLSGAATATTTTDANGYYSFPNLANGSYTITLTTTGPLAGMVNTFDPDVSGAGNNATTFTIAGANLFNRDFGWRLAPGTSTLSGTLWLDANGDGTLEGSEAGRFQNVTVVLKDLSGNVVATTTTSATGDYSFTNLAAGTYTITVTDETQQTAGYNLTNGANDGQNNNSQINPYTVTVAAGATNSTGDFGFVPYGTGILGDTVWKDTNGDGEQGVGEPGIANVLVTLQVDLNGGSRKRLPPRSASQML